MNDLDNNTNISTSNKNKHEREDLPRTPERPTRKGDPTASPEKKSQKVEAKVTPSHKKFYYTRFVKEDEKLLEEDNSNVS